MTQIAIRTFSYFRNIALKIKIKNRFQNSPFFDGKNQILTPFLLVEAQPVGLKATIRRYKG